MALGTCCLPHARHLCSQALTSLPQNPPTHVSSLPCAAALLPAADDELLVRWRKIESPFLHLPPPDLQLTGWRDPFIFATNTSAAPSEWEWKGEWLLVVGGRAAGVVGVLA